MKVLKWVGISIFILVVIALVAAALLPKNFKYERSIVVNKPIDTVFEYVKLIKNQDNYGVWQLSDPNMSKTYQGTDGTVGFRYSWKSEEMGEGTQTITQLESPSKLVTSLDFGFGEPATAVFALNKISEQSTNVTWSLEGTSMYPFNLMLLCVDMGKDFEEGLRNLKNVLEK
jgi:hypothetical protein